MGHLLDKIRTPEFQAEYAAKVQAHAERWRKEDDEQEARLEQWKEKDAKRQANIVRDTLSNLREEGWSETTRKNIYKQATYPSSGRIILEHPCQDYALVYTFTIYEDYSDCPGDNVKIAWQKADFVERVVYDVVCR